MKVSVVTGPGETRVVDVPKPTVGPANALVKIRACGICGSDAFYISMGGVPPRQGQTPLGQVDFVNIMSNEITIVGSMGYPDEIFEVTKDIIANWERYAVIVSHTIPFDNVYEALRTASTPGAAEKVVVTFN
jgi:threonine dehydrogenase-like Zn-dependent dehydrogenase